jgi:tetratricopeptide (TPR) repeat protein
MGRAQESLAAMNRALELDPVSPVINVAVAWHCHIYTRQYGRAIEELRNTLRLEPGFARAHWALALAYEHSAQVNEAIEELRKAVTLSGGSPYALSSLGHAYAISGRTGEARQILQDLKGLSKRRYVSPYETAQIYAGLGENENAFTWLERAYEERASGLRLLKVEPWLDPLRGDTRFANLLLRVGLPQ